MTNISMGFWGECTYECEDTIHGLLVQLKGRKSKRDDAIITYAYVNRLQRSKLSDFCKAFVA